MYICMNYRAPGRWIERLVDRSRRRAGESTKIGNLTFVIPSPESMFVGRWNEIRRFFIGIKSPFRVPGFFGRWDLFWPPLPLYGTYIAFRSNNWISFGQTIGPVRPCWRLAVVHRQYSVRTSSTRVWDENKNSTLSNGYANMPFRFKSRSMTMIEQGAAVFLSRNGNLGNLPLGLFAACPRAPIDYCCIPHLVPNSNIIQT